MDRKTLLADLTRAELGDLVTSLGFPRFHADQVFTAFYQKRAVDFGAMTGLGKALRATLAGRIDLGLPVLARTAESADGTRKFLFRLADGHTVESVLMPIRGRLTLCASSQVGCRFGCRFCLTGCQGFVRNLRTSEIVGQVVASERTLPAGEKIRNLVFMGMGEPLDNYENVTRAIRILEDDFGPGLSSRRVTVSTVGLVPGLTRLARETDLEVSLAVSINAADDATRSALMPVNRKYPLATLAAALRAFPMRRRKRITAEYVLLAGVNDRRADADRLARLLSGVRCMVNLIPYNPHPGAAFAAPREEDVLAFQERLHHHGYRAIIRRSRGADILAACGQLRSAEAEAQSPMDRCHGVPR